MSSPSTPSAGRPESGAGVPAPPVTPALIVFSLLRFGLIVILTAVLMAVTKVPLIIALTIAIILQLPLSLLLFGRQRERLNLALAARNVDRRAERERLRSELRGDGR